MLVLFKYASAAQLFIFASPKCTYFEQWEKEIFAINPLNKKGGKASLLRVSMHDDISGDLHKLMPVIYTPTFVLSYDGWELGRISGYTVEDSFWGFLESLMSRLPRNSSTCYQVHYPEKIYSKKVVLC
jgi:thioredoxin-related protein